MAETEKVDPKFASLVSTVCSNQGNVKETIVKLLNVLLKNQSSFVSDGSTGMPGDKAASPTPCPSLVYATKRVIRGCASRKEECRMSCALFLSALLSTFNSILSLEQIYEWTKSLLNSNIVGTGNPASDSRIINIGRLAVFSAVLFSKAQVKLGGVLEKMLEDLLDIRTKGSYLSWSVDALLLKFAGQSGEKAEVSAFLLEKLSPESACLLKSALHCLVGVEKDIFVPTITSTTKNVIDFLPRLHPSLKVIACSRFDLISPQLDWLLCSESRDLQLVAVLVLRESNLTSFPRSFLALAEKLYSQKRLKGQRGEELRKAVDDVVQQYVCSVEKCSLDSLGQTLSDCPVFLLQKLSLPIIEQLNDDSFEQLSSQSSANFSGSKRADYLHLLFKRKRNLTEGNCKIVANLLTLSVEDEEFIASFRAKVASLISSCSPASLRALTFAIASTFFKKSTVHESDDPKGPLRVAKKAFKKMIKSDDHLISFGCCCFGTMLALSSDGATALELLQELDGFNMKRSELSCDEKSLFWSETVLSLLSKEQSFIRKMAEILFIDVCKSGHLNAVSIDQFCEIIVKEPHSSNNFEVDEDEDEDENDNQNSANLTLINENDLMDDSEDLLGDEEMSKLDQELAAVVSMHVKSTKKSSKKLQAAGTIIQSKTLSLLELLSRSREVSLSSKFSIIPRLIQTLAELELAKKSEKDFIDRLHRVIKCIIDSCKDQSTFDWLALLEMALCVKSKRAKLLSIIAYIFSVGNRNGVDIDVLIRPYIEQCLLGQEGIVELSMIIPCMANYGMSHVLEEHISSLIPLKLPLNIKYFAKSSLLRSFHSIKCKTTNIADHIVDVIVGDVIAELSNGQPKATWIRSQLSELHLWCKSGLAKEKWERLVELREKLPNPKLIDQLNNTLKVTKKQ